MARKTKVLGLARKLHEKFGQSEDDVKRALKMLSRAGRVAKPALPLDVLRDAADNRILECAVDAGADLVVTGDRHRLRLHEFGGVPIVRLAVFLRMFPEAPA